MDKNGQHIDNFFNKKLKNHEFAYKAEYWEKMAGVLNNPSAVITTSATKILGLSKTVFWGIASFIPVATIVSVLVLTNHPEQKPQTVGHPKNTNQIALNHSESKTQTSGEIISSETTTFNRQETAISDNQANHQQPNQQQPIIAANPPFYPDEMHISTIDIDRNETSASISTEKQSLNNKISSKKDSLAAEKIEKPKIDSFIKADSQLVNNHVNPNRPDRNTLSIYTGLSLNHFFDNTKTNSFGYNSNVIAGIGYNLPVNDKISVAIDIGYNRIKNNCLTRYSVNYLYTYYKEFDSITLKTHTLEFLDFNFNLKNNITAKHRLSLGLYSSWLLNTYSTKNEIISSPFYYFSNTTQEKFYYEGLRRFNYGLSTVYEYTMLEYGFLGLRYNFALNDFVNDKKFNQSKSNHLSNLQLYFRWMIY